MKKIKSDTLTNTEFYQYPARLTAEDVALILGFNGNDIPILVNNGMLRPLGKPVPNAVKYFAAVDIEALIKERGWLNKATQLIYDYWSGKNAKKRKITPPLPMITASPEMAFTG